MWGIELDRAGGRPLKRQIYACIKDRITDGLLDAGDALPSTRELAKALNVSRATVGEAYDMLIAEGFVSSRQGAPTRVAEGLLVERAAAAPPARPAAPTRALKADFQTGRPDLRAFPHGQWRQLLSKAAAELPPDLYGYTGPDGLYELRAEISAWLLRSRGLEAGPDEIFITAGATHALHVLTELLDVDKKEVLMEDPCHSGMLRTFADKGCRIVPVPADAAGLDTRYLPKATGAGAVYVTPSHQFPLGGILPAARRAALVRYARENGLYIIEDDYDSEYRYTGDPVAPLYMLDPQHVIYVGTFSKVLFPALRIGYAILPPPLRRRWRNLRTHTDVQNPPFNQAALAEFLRSRKFDSHIRKMRRAYGQRRGVLLDALTENFGDGWAAFGDSAGLHVAVDFPGRRFDAAFKQKALQNGVYVTPLESHCIVKGRHESKLMLGYGHLEPDALRSGVRLLAQIMDHP